MVEPAAGKVLDPGTPIEELLGPLTPEQGQNVPDALHYRGDRSLLGPGRTRVSIVGSRRASPDGLRRAMQLARDLVRRDIVIVSGLALGIDTVAHETAIAYGGRTIAVLGTAVDECHPAANSQLHEKIGQDHLLLSRLAAGRKTGKWAFPARNRLMALISDATVIIEAGETSGTQHQGWEAIRLNTPLLLAQSLVDRELEWAGMMIGYGARPFNSVDEVFDVVASGVNLEQPPF